VFSQKVSYLEILSDSSITVWGRDLLA
jgi:hypothetical protein